MLCVSSIENSVYPVAHGQVRRLTINQIRPLRVSEGIFLWGDRSLSSAFIKLRCEHHLISERNHILPHLPSLTPNGFSQWIKILLEAHPEQEVLRLKSVVREIPINNPDNEGERFPKDFSRRLFPKFPNQRLQHWLQTLLEAHEEKKPSHSYMSNDPNTAFRRR